jgi:hypothetical protein
MSEFSRWLSRRNPQYFVEQQGGLMPPVQQNPTAPPAQTPAEKLRQRLERDKQKTPHYIDPVTGNTVMRIQPIRQYLKQNQTPNQPPVKPDLQQKQNPYQPPVTPAPKNADMKNLKIQDIYSKQKYTPQLFSSYYPNFENIEEVLLKNIRDKNGMDQLDDADITYLVIGMTDGTFPSMEDTTISDLFQETLEELLKRKSLPIILKTNIIKKLSVKLIAKLSENYLSDEYKKEILSIYIKDKGGVEKLSKNDIVDLALYGYYSFLPNDTVEKLLTTSRIKRDINAIEALKGALRTGIKKGLTDQQITNIPNINFILARIHNDEERQEVLNLYIKNKKGVDNLSNDDLYNLCKGISGEYFDKTFLSKEKATELYNNRKDLDDHTRSYLRFLHEELDLRYQRSKALE